MFAGSIKRYTTYICMSASVQSQIDVCLIGIVQCFFIIAAQERITIENAFSNIKKFGLFNRMKSRVGSYGYNELPSFFLAACVPHICDIQFYLQNGCEPTAERPCKCAE